jgi:hypothetical protein
VGLKAGLDAVEKRKSLPCRGSNPGRPVARCYADSANPIPNDYIPELLIYCSYLTADSKIGLDIVTCITIARQRLCKHIPAKRTNATEGRQLLGNGQVNMPP